MSLWCITSIRCVIKQEYREFIDAVFTVADICGKNNEYLEYFDEMRWIAQDLYEDKVAKGYRELFVAILKDKGVYSEIDDEEEYNELLNAINIQNEYYRKGNSEIKCFLNTLYGYSVENNRLYNSYIENNTLYYLLKKNKKDDVELPIFDKETGEFNMYVEYNMHGSNQTLLLDLEELLDEISEDGIEHLYYWNEICI